MKLKMFIDLMNAVVIGNLEEKFNFLKLEMFSNMDCDERVVKLFEKCMDELATKERNVLNQRFGLYNGRPETLDSVGMFYSVSRECIRQIEAKALRKLRHRSRIKYLEEACMIQFIEIMHLLGFYSMYNLFIEKNLEDRKYIMDEIKKEAMLANYLYLGYSKRYYDMSIIKIDLPKNIKENLLNGGIKTFGELVCKNDEDILSIKYIGEAALEVIITFLANSKIE